MSFRLKTILGIALIEGLLLLLLVVMSMNMFRDTLNEELIKRLGMENDEIVMNDERRKKFKQWFLAALMNAGSKVAKFRVVGTILHMDSLLESFMPQLDCPMTVDMPLMSYSTDEKKVWRSVRYRAHDPEFTQLLFF